MPVLRRCAGTAFMSRSPNRISPASGSTNPAIMRSSVVLPQPEGPSRKKNSPFAISSDTSRTVATSPYFLLMFFRIHRKHGSLRYERLQTTGNLRQMNTDTHRYG